MDAENAAGRSRGLTPRQRQFVEGYLEDGDAAAAAIRAGYCRSRAANEGRRLRKLPQIREAIDAGLREKARRELLDEEHVRDELARIAFADISDFLRWDENGISLRPMDELTREQTACVAEIVESAGRTGKTLRVKLHPKLAALAALSRLLPGAKPAGEGASGQLLVVTSVPEPFPLPDPEHPETSGWPPSMDGDGDAPSRPSS